VVEDSVGRSIYLDRILRREAEFQPIRFSLIERVRVYDLDVHKPGLEVVGLDERYAWWEFLVHL
jgi:hypothetical protein